jgi:pimeloyl-ACP methyl ester carboxylesterase
MTSRRFALNGETLHLDDSLRSTIAGTFIRLPDGMTWYELAGPVDRPVVVFTNGYSIPHFLWDHTFQPLADAGYRVLRFDHFGRGWSDRPNIDYGPDTFDRQLVDLLQALDITTPISLVGSSMGGIVASIFADRHPKQVNKLVLIDPAGMMDPPVYPKSLLLMPLLGELVMHLTGDRTIPAGMAEDLLYPERFPEYIENYLPQMKIGGFKRALLSTMRSRMLFNQRAVYERLGQTGVPILLLWGEYDQTIPLTIGQAISSLLTQADFQVIEDAGHVPHYERPDVVNPMVIRFLKGEYLVTSINH